MGQEYVGRLENSLVKAVELPEPKKDTEVMETYTEAKENITEREEAKKLDIPMHDVESSNIRSMGYDKASKQLRVQFTNGGLFQYKEVLPELVSELKKSESIGSFFSKHIRTTHECVKLN